MSDTDQALHASEGRGEAGDTFLPTLPTDVHVTSFTADEAAGEAVLRLHAEEVSVGRRAVQGRVQVHVQTVTREHVVDEALSHERVEVERVAIGRPVDSVPPDRQEGDTTVISVVEEVVVVHRQLVLREEVRVRRVRVTEQHRETVSLRVQEAVVERSALEPVSGNAEL